jgi:ribonuclease Z
MDLDVVFLGTAGSMPTARRSPTALVVRRGGERLLFDCGEGSQRQFLRSKLGLVDLGEVFLTHYHADHYLGLPGMLKTFSLRGRELPLTVFGPPGLKDLFSALRRIFGRLTFALDLVELQPGDALERDGYRLETFPVEHGVSSLGYALVELPRPGRFDVQGANELGVPPGPERGALQRGEAISLGGGRVVRPEQVLGSARPGRKLVISGDSAPCRAVVEAAGDADLLVHEATFCEEERERAEETHHSTAAQAAQIALAARVKMLALTHVSTRYFGPEVLREARELFAKTVVPRDFDIIDLPFQERGEPRLLKGGALPVEGGETGAEPAVRTAGVEEKSE